MYCDYASESEAHLSLSPACCTVIRSSERIKLGLKITIQTYKQIRMCITQEVKCVVNHRNFIKPETRR